MEKNKNIVLKASDYDQVDGKAAYSKKEKQVSIGYEDGEIVMKLQDCLLYTSDAADEEFAV